MGGYNVHPYNLNSLKRLKMNNVVFKEVHISTIKVGDTIFYDGHLRTITKNNMGYHSFIGSTLFGDSFNMGTIKVKKALFKVPTNKGIVYR